MQPRRKFDCPAIVSIAGPLVLFGLVAFPSAGHAECEFSWQDGGGIPGTDRPVYTIAHRTEGAVDAMYVGGIFTIAGDSFVNYIARWDGQNWSPLGTGLAGDSTPIATSLVYNGDLIAGGIFTQAGGNPASRIARWNGTSWSPLGTGVVNGSNISALHVWGTKLYATGSFIIIGGVVTQRLATWNGTAWASPGIFLSNTINCMDTYQGDLIFGGDIIGLNTTTAPFSSTFFDYIVRWNGSAAMRLGNGLNSNVNAILDYGSDLVAGGSFDQIGNIQANGIAKWDGANWQTLLSGSQISGIVYDMIEFGGNLYVGGNFSSAGASPNLARWNGSAWSAIPGGSPGSFVNTLSIFGSDLIAAGSFTAAGSVPLSRIGKWDGTMWSPLGTGMNGLVSDTFVFNDNLIAAGEFTTAGGNPADRIAAWDGNAWSPLGTGLSAPARALTVYEGDLIVGGQFLSAGGLPTARIARWDGEQWHAMGNGFDGTVYSLGVFRGKLIAGGLFFGGNGEAPFLAVWTGTAWAEIGGGIYGDVHAIYSRPSELFIGGRIYTVGEHVSIRFAKGSVLGSPPEIIVSPLNTNGTWLGSVMLEVLSDDDGTYDFIWRKDGQRLNDDSRIHGSETPTLIIDPVDLTDQGSYDVVVRSFCGSTASTSASVIVTCGMVQPTGDLNDDGGIDGQDIAPFVESILDASQAGVNVCHADFDYDRVMSEQDIPHFVSALLAE
ncbi:hypothetical protein B7486_23705 [cyanobacterium TDX16]|nr:hypothetical protein B7486_23705 [cyanobacterium TDX16]